MERLYCKELLQNRLFYAHLICEIYMTRSWSNHFMCKISGLIADAFSSDKGIVLMTVQQNWTVGYRLDELFESAMCYPEDALFQLVF